MSLPRKRKENNERSPLKRKKIFHNVAHADKNLLSDLDSEVKVENEFDNLFEEEADLEIKDELEDIKLDISYEDVRDFVSESEHQTEHSMNQNHKNTDAKASISIEKSSKLRNSSSVAKIINKQKEALKLIQVALMKFESVTKDLQELVEFDIGDAEADLEDCLDSASTVQIEVTDLLSQHKEDCLKNSESMEINSNSSIDPLQIKSIDEVQSCVLEDSVAASPGDLPVKDKLIDIVEESSQASTKSKSSHIQSKGSSVPLHVNEKQISGNEHNELISNGNDEDNGSSDIMPDSVISSPNERHSTPPSLQVEEPRPSTSQDLEWTELKELPEDNYKVNVKLECKTDQIHRNESADTIIISESNKNKENTVKNNEMQLLSGGDVNVNMLLENESDITNDILSKAFSFWDSEYKEKSPSKGTCDIVSVETFKAHSNKALELDSITYSNSDTLDRTDEKFENKISIKDYYKLPHIPLNTKLGKALYEKKPLTRSLRGCLLDAIYEDFKNKKKLYIGHEYSNVACELLKKYPYLQMNLDFEAARHLWVKSLRAKFNNEKCRADKDMPEVVYRKQNRKRTSERGSSGKLNIYDCLEFWEIPHYRPSMDESIEDETSIASYQMLMAEEFKKAKKNEKAIDIRMDRTFTHRRSLLFREIPLSILDILKQYPCLSLQSQAIKEICRLFGQKVYTKFAEKLDSFALNLAFAARESRSNYAQYVDSLFKFNVRAQRDIELYKILGYIPMLLCEDPSTIIGPQRDITTPYLEINENHVTIKVDNIDFISNVKAENAVLLWCASFFIFNIEIPQSTRRTFYLLQKLIFDIPAKFKPSPIYTKILNLYM